MEYSSIKVPLMLQRLASGLVCYEATMPVFSVFLESYKNLPFSAIILFVHRITTFDNYDSQMLAAFILLLGS